jgi:phasin family protein
MTKPQENFLTPLRIIDDLVGKLQALSIPGIDVEAVIASQRKNIEALVAASRTTMDSVNALGKRQAEILQETMSQTAYSLETMIKAGSPFDIAAKQAELTKEGFEKALGNMRELAEMVTKAQHGAMDPISHRVSESLDELKQMALKTTESSAPPPSAPKTKPVEAMVRAVG